MQETEARGRRAARGLAGAVLSIAALVALGVILGQAQWQDLARPLLTAQYGWLGVALAMALLVEVFKTIRWSMLLDAPTSAVPRLLGLVFSSRLLNTITPVRAGDVWRVVSVSRSEGRPLSLATGSVLLEKVLDGTVLAAVASLFIGTSMVAVGSTQARLGVAAATIAVALLALGGGRHRPIRIRLSRWFQPASHLRRWPRLSGIGLLTIGGITSGLLVNLATLAALGLPVEPSLGAAMLLSAYASGLLPSAPGQVGVFELAVSGSLIASGLTSGAAVTAAVAVHLVLLATLAIGAALSVPLTALGPAAAGSRGDPKRGPSSIQEIL